PPAPGLPRGVRAAGRAGVADHAPARPGHLHPGGGGGHVGHLLRRPASAAHRAARAAGRDRHRPCGSVLVRPVPGRRHDRDRLGRRVRQGLHAGHADAPGVHPRAHHRLHLRGLLGGIRPAGQRLPDPGLRVPDPAWP
ncbi:hypothetical protein OY671_010842, partial [Metschnikowia pulcherrima]